MRYRLRQVQIAHRHGDRTPLWNAFAGSKAEERMEMERWMTKLPSDKKISDLCSKYLTVSELPKIAPNRLVSDAFGRLTSIGMQQLMERGAQLRQSILQHDANGTFFSKLEPGNVLIYANSHERTQLSVKALLLGLLNVEKNLFPLHINLLPSEQDFLNRYALHSELVEMKAEMEKTDLKLRNREAEMQGVKDKLCASLPIFSHKKHKFVWMIAADYYTCRISHEFQLISGIEDIYRETMEHLSFRFQRFYSDPAILYLLAGGIMEQIHTHILQAVNRLDGLSVHLIAYSGHDVTLLAILNFLGASVVREKSWWPEYGTVIAFQLLESEDGECFVRLEMNGELIHLDYGSAAFMPVETFCRMIKDRMISIMLQAGISHELYSE